MRQRPMLHFLCGKLASGKTTLARRLAEEHAAVLIIEDVWLNRLFPGEINDFADYLRYSDRFRRALQPHLQELLRLGLSVVLDFAGNRQEERDWVRSVLESGGYDHRLHYIHASDELCKQQLHERNRARPEGAALISDEEFDTITAYFIPPVPEEGFVIINYAADRLRRLSRGMGVLTPRSGAMGRRRRTQAEEDVRTGDDFTGLEEPVVDVLE